MRRDKRVKDGEKEENGRLLVENSKGSLWGHGGEGKVWERRAQNNVIMQ